MQITDSVLLIKPTRLYRPDMSGDELYEATRGVWKVAEKKVAKAAYVLAVVANEVVEVYAIERWQRAGTAQYHFRPRREVDRPNRLEFVGRAAQDSARRYVGMSVKEYFPKGAQNPIRYVNC